MIRQHQYSLYDIFAVLFVTTLLVSNIVSVKIVSVGWLTFDAGTVLFPLAYIVGDIITEVYGYRRMRRLIYNGLAALMLMTLTFWVVQLLPVDSSWTGQAAFESTLGVVWRLAISSVTALFVGEIMNAYVMGRMKVASRGRGLWWRMIGSSAAGSALDTVIFSTIAFAGTMPTTSFWQLIITVFLIKMAVEIMVSPLTIRLIARVKKHEKLDTFEQPAKYLVN